MSEDEKKRVIQNIISFYQVFQKEILDVFVEDNKKLSPLSFKALCEIHFTEEVTPSILAKRLAITVTNTSRCLQRLSSAGYIIKVQDKRDKRITHIRLTEKGLELVEKSKESVDELMIKKLGVLELDELIRLSESFSTTTELLAKIGTLNS